jgi:hypothetical protein
MVQIFVPEGLRNFALWNVEGTYNDKWCLLPFKRFFFDMGSQPESFPPSHEYNNLKTFGPIPFVLFCLALRRQCKSHASWTDWLLENQVFWLLSKWVLAAFLGTGWHTPCSTLLQGGGTIGCVALNTP